MPMLCKQLARVILCAAVALPVIAPVKSFAEGRRGATYEERLEQSKQRTAERMTAPRKRHILVGGTELTAQAKSTKSGPASISQSEFQCLSEALYFEARGEGHKGQAAVAEVILNRVDSRKFPDSVCGVVNQKGQFSYKGAGAKKIREKGAYKRSQNIARAALQGAPRTLTDGATYFHTPAVKPSWARRFVKTVKIGSHIFYRPRGQRIASN